ncbi:MAG TPA: LmeA family phospholipid-binding protein [Caldimonas sp.]|jgi:hypothetical protein|nr:LmeA family phospholipid-binding protein [Caldimonas sp.]HEX2540184.1 LmeA family phospholipid-binding protein [Caldimonas sp.]
MKPTWTLAAAVLAAFLVACAGTVDRHVEGAIRESLPRLVGPADRYDVTVRGADAGGSRIAEVRAIGVRVQRPRWPVLDRVDVNLGDVVVDRAERRVTSIGRAAIALHLREQDLTEFLGRQPWLESGTLAFSGSDEITIAGRLGVPGLPAAISSPRAELRGRLVPRGAQLLLRVDAITFGDRAAPPLVRRVVEQTINPLFDAADHAVPSQLDSVAVVGGELVVRASGSDLTLRRDAPR